MTKDGKPMPISTDGNDPMREVVGTLYNGTIYPQIIEGGEFVTRARMQFMAACDLGKKWDDWAKAPTLGLIKK